MDCSLPGSLVHGVFQARILEWVAISFSRNVLVDVAKLTCENVSVVCFQMYSDKNVCLPIPLSKLLNTSCLVFFLYKEKLLISLVTFHILWSLFLLLIIILLPYDIGLFVIDLKEPFVLYIATRSFCYVLQIFSSSLSSLLSFYVVFFPYVLFRKDFVEKKKKIERTLLP